LKNPGLKWLATPRIRTFQPHKLTVEKPLLKISGMNILELESPGMEVGVKTSRVEIFCNRSKSLNLNAKSTGKTLFRTKPILCLKMMGNPFLKCLWPNV
jgi:hypothetical protein